MNRARKLPVLLLVALALGLVGSCRKSDPHEGTESSARRIQVGQRLVSDGEFQRYIQRELGLNQEELEPVVAEQLREQLYAEVLLARAAERLGVSVDSLQEADEVAALEALETGASEDELKIEARRALLARAYEETVLAGEVRISPEDVASRLGKAPRLGARSFMVFRQILVEEKTVADDAYRRIVRKHEPFSSVAAELTLGPDGGAVQQVPIANLPEAAARALGSLPEGGVSRPVLVGRYYYLFQLDARNRDPDPGRAREREMIEHKLFQERFDQLRIERLGKLAREEGVRAPDLGGITR